MAYTTVAAVVAGTKVTATWGNSVSTAATELQLTGVQTSAPGSPAVGNMWFDTTLFRLYRRTTISATDYNMIVGGSMPRVSLNQTVGQSHTTSGSYQNFNTSVEVFDTDAFHAASDAFVTIPVGFGGDYNLACGVTFAANATGSRAIRATIASNTSATNEQVSIIAGGEAMVSTANNGVGFAQAVRLEAGATVTFDVFQSSGGALSMSSYFASLVMVTHMPNLT